MKKTGIDAISFYVPKLFVDMEKLAIKRNISFEKLNKGLGLNKMSIPDCDEDTASFAANALLNLITSNNLDPREIGRIYIGTESALDGSKPISTYVIQVLEEILNNKFGFRCFKNCDVVDLTFACVGAVDALQNCNDWVVNGVERKAVVIASDLAKYELESTGEYTQGAGAVALLIKENPSIISITNKWGVATKSVGDFFKPRRVYDKEEILKETAKLLGKEISNDEASKILNKNNSEFWSSSNANFEIYKEEPIFEGQFSNECYEERIFEALDHFISQKNINIFEDWNHLIFHLPYAFHGRRMLVKKWTLWLDDNNKLDQLTNEIGKVKKGDEKAWIKLASKSELYNDFVVKKIAPGEIASSEIGNMYTASIFMSLLSMLNNAITKKIELTNNKIGFISYGSGSKAKIFEGIIESSWKIKLKSSNLFEILDKRKDIDVGTYEDLHRNKIKDPISEYNSSIKLSKIQEGEFTRGLRSYKFK
ncbi:MAG: hydroxymethylglutaryl-CoA synthase [Candidatus Marivariicella framensis]|jgi:hydroxymethylglutaryl-CoA synthase|tara:strand:- start:4605 stop:6047 length:1443 start_codon:yes stop_codon:yes gene_type:complete